MNMEKTHYHLHRVRLSFNKTETEIRSIGLIVTVISNFLDAYLHFITKWSHANSFNKFQNMDEAQKN